jgi:hypothetical protein
MTQAPYGVISQNAKRESSANRKAVNSIAGQQDDDFDQSHSGPSQPRK